MSGPAKNAETLGHSNAELSLIHALNKLAEQPETSVNELAKSITEIVNKQPAVVLAAIFLKSTDQKHLMLVGYSSKKRLRIARPVRIDLDMDWFLSPKNSHIIVGGDIDAEKAAKYLNWSVADLVHNDGLLGAETFYLAKLKNRGHNIGLLAICMNDKADLNHPSIKATESVKGLIANILSGLISERENHSNLRRLKEFTNRASTLDEVKDDFISMASHQLRTPLTSTKGYISMILEGDAGPINEEQKKMLAQAFASCQRMVYTISDLLNVSRLNTGKFVMEFSSVNLDYVIKDEVDQLKEIAKAREIKIDYTPDPHIPDLTLDETKIRQVIMNFIDNALYYTPAGGQIEISLKASSASVELRVRDNGLGVPRSEQRHLFTKFYRATNARKARPDGTGLGLFMAKKVVIALGGAIIFESQEDKGSTFGFIFPVKTS